MGAVGERMNLNGTDPAKVSCERHRLEREFPIRTAGKEVVASLVTPTFGGPTETKKARYVVASSRVR